MPNPGTFGDDDEPIVEGTSIAPIVQKLGEIFSRKDRKTILIFNGDNTIYTITKGLMEAEQIANVNEWDDEQR